MIKSFWGDLMKYFDNGRNNVFGRGYQIVQLVMTFAIYFSIRGENIGLLEIFNYSIILFILMAISGFVYNILGLLSAEASSRNKDNPELIEVLNNTRKILKIQGGLNEIKKRKKEGKNVCRI